MQALGSEYLGSCLFLELGTCIHSPEVMCVLNDKSINNQVLVMSRFYLVHLDFNLWTPFKLFGDLFDVFLEMFSGWFFCSAFWRVFFGHFVWHCFLGGFGRCFFDVLEGIFWNIFWGTVGTYSLSASFCNIFPRSNVSNIFAIFNLFTISGTTKSVYYNIVVVFVMLFNTLLIFPNTMFILLARDSENIWICWRLT